MHNTAQARRIVESASGVMNFAQATIKANALTKQTGYYWTAIRWGTRWVPTAQFDPRIKERYNAIA